MKTQTAIALARGSGRPDWCDAQPQHNHAGAQSVSDPVRQAGGEHPIFLNSLSAKKSSSEEHK